MSVSVERLGKLLARGACGGLFRRAPSTPEQVLAAGAQIYLNFISSTQDISQNDVMMRHAAHRYQRFLHLTNKGSHPVPTDDISIIWAAQMLNPSKYNAHVQGMWYEHQQVMLLRSGLHIMSERSLGRFSAGGSIFGGCVGLATTGHPLGAMAGALLLARKTEKVKGAVASLPLDAFDTNGDGIVTTQERDLALREWDRRYVFTENLWKQEFEEMYSLPCHLHDGVASCALSSAAQRQNSFNKRILKLRPTITSDWINDAVARYFQFLTLTKENPGKLLVPTLDVDLIWHAHMLSPDDYKADCQAVLGRLLSHDDTIAEDELETSFEATERLWSERFGTTYVRPSPTPKSGFKRDDRARCGGCGIACGGWTGARSRQQIHHNSLEPQIPAAEHGSIAPQQDSLAPEKVADGLIDVWSEPVGWGAIDDVWSEPVGGAIDAGSSCGSSSCGAGGCGGCGGG